MAQFEVLQFWSQSGDYWIFSDLKSNFNRTRLEIYVMIKLFVTTTVGSFRNFSSKSMILASSAQAKIGSFSMSLFPRIVRIKEVGPSRNSSARRINRVGEKSRMALIIPTSHSASRTSQFWTSNSLLSRSTKPVSREERRTLSFFSNKINPFEIRNYTTGFNAYLKDCRPVPLRKNK